MKNKILCSSYASFLLSLTITFKWKIKNNLYAFNPTKTIKASGSWTFNSGTLKENGVELKTYSDWRMHNLDFQTFLTTFSFYRWCHVVRWDLFWWQTPKIIPNIIKKWIKKYEMWRMWRWKSVGKSRNGMGCQCISF